MRCLVSVAYSNATMIFFQTVVWVVLALRPESMRMMGCVTALGTIIVLWVDPLGV